MSTGFDIAAAVSWSAALFLAALSALRAALRLALSPFLRGLACCSAKELLLFGGWGSSSDVAASCGWDARSRLPMCLLDPFAPVRSSVASGCSRVGVRRVECEAVQDESRGGGKQATGRGGEERGGGAHHKSLQILALPSQPISLSLTRNQQTRLLAVSRKEEAKRSLLLRLLAAPRRPALVASTRTLFVIRVNACTTRTARVTYGGT